MMEPAYGALRKSIFPGVPPFINFVPIGGFTGKIELREQQTQKFRKKREIHEKFWINFLAPKKDLKIVWNIWEKHLGKIFEKYFEKNGKHFEKKISLN